MKVLVTGVKGQLGYDIVRLANQYEIEAVGKDIDEMDITDFNQVEHVITESHVDFVIHCAAFTAVDAAEQQQELCYQVNVVGTENIAKVCEKLDIPMMYFSTDYVFNGLGDHFWEVNDAKEPINVYGQTKYQGEEVVQKLDKHFIIRIAWVFGVNGHNFIKTMLKLAETRDELSVVDDQIGSPTYTYDLAHLVLKMIQTKEYGVYHATNEGICSWYEFATEIFKMTNTAIKVNPIDSASYPVKTIRPKNSRLSKKSLDDHGFDRLPSWQDALSRYLKELGYGINCEVD